MADIAGNRNPGYWGRGRALHVIDLENLVGGDQPTPRSGDVEQL
jgi:hypothetical protein